MTTDPFTEAARAEAEDYARTPRMNVGTVRDRIAEAHRAGAEWARTHLAAHDARVRRDAAREALDGIAGDFDLWGGVMDGDEVARRIRHHRDTHYPEGTP